jgi:nucleoside-diphosphate-sugar epimerase
MNMLELARTLGCPVLQASTSEVYGDPEIHPQPEDYWGRVNPIGPRSCYDEGKRCAETLFFDYRRAHGVAIKVARIFNTYGPRMDAEDGRVVSNFVVQALAGKPITVYGDGSQTRSFCYVDDRPGQSRQSGRVHHRRAGRQDSRDDREPERGPLLAIARGRSAPAPARHQPRQEDPRLDAARFA